MKIVDEAFAAMDRSKFLPPDAKDQSAIDISLPIGHDQTGTQPSVMYEMLTWLDPQPGDKILDVGYGSGWSTALLSRVVGRDGMIYGVEKILDLAKFGAMNCKKAGVKNAHFFEADGMFGLVDYAPYDRILVSASSRAIPPWLLNQLKPGGKIVIPIHEDILEITKISDSELQTVRHPGYVFVPLA